MTDMQCLLIDHMGSDLSVVNAARVSFHKTHDKLDETGDPKLIAYLAQHGHWSPFAHCFLQFRIKAPIFVARQLVKHQVGLAWNEVSRRYVSDQPEFYDPGVWRGAPTDGAKQGSSGVVEDQDMCYDHLVATMNIALSAYDGLLRQGVAPEMARMVLPQNMMTEWIWSGSLYAFARVCSLRLDSHAQAETSVIAERISDECRNAFPHSWAALVPKQAGD